MDENKIYAQKLLKKLRSEEIDCTRASAGLGIVSVSLGDLDVNVAVIKDIIDQLSEETGLHFSEFLIDF